MGGVETDLCGESNMGLGVDRMWRSEWQFISRSVLSTADNRIPRSVIILSIDWTFISKYRGSVQVQTVQFKKNSIWEN